MPENIDKIYLNSYEDVRSAVTDGYVRNINILIVTFPGYSAFYQVQKLVEFGEFEDLSYINKADQKLSRYSILDFDFANNKDALRLVEKYVKEAKTNQKFVVVINAPWVMETNTFNASYIGTHHYMVYKFTRPTLEMTEKYALEMGVKDATKDELSKIYELAGGIGRLNKFLITNRKLIGESADKIILNTQVENLIRPLVSAYSRVDEELLMEYGVKADGKFTSSLVESYVAKHPLSLKFDLKVNKALELMEDGESTSVLSGFEANILEHLVENEGVITKDKVAEIKWGSESYADFSDEAIKKTMLRLGEKIKKYKFEAIPSYGYKIVKR